MWKRPTAIPTTTEPNKTQYRHRNNNNNKNCCCQTRKKVKLKINSAHVLKMGIVYVKKSRMNERHGEQAKKNTNWITNEISREKNHFILSFFFVHSLVCMLSVCVCVRRSGWMLADASAALCIRFPLAYARYILPSENKTFFSVFLLFLLPLLFLLIVVIIVLMSCQLCFYRIRSRFHSVRIIFFFFFFEKCLLPMSLLQFIFLLNLIFSFCLSRTHSLKNIPKLVGICANTWTKFVRSVFFVNNLYTTSFGKWLIKYALICYLAIKSDCLLVYWLVFLHSITNDDSSCKFRSVFFSLLRRPHP